MIMAAMEARFQAILSTFTKQQDANKKKDASSQQSEDGSKTSGQASETDTNQHSGDSWEEPPDINSLLQDVNSGGKKSRNTSEILKTPTRNAPARTIGGNLKSRKSFDPQGKTSRW